MTTTDGSLDHTIFLGFTAFPGTVNDADKYRDVIRKKTKSKTLDWNSIMGRESWYCQLNEEKLVEKITQAMKETDFYKINPHLEDSGDYKFIQTVEDITSLKD